MKDLYDQADNAELIARITKIAPGTKPQWGKMTAAQMLAHCQVPLKISFEELIMKRGLAGILFGKIAKKKMLSDTPFPKNLPTFKEAKVNEDKNLENEKRGLINYVSRLAVQGPDGITKRPHPFFGKLTTQEWNLLQYKHLDHHLKQFGV